MSESFTGARILVVDDVSLNRRLLERMLASRGCDTVLLASNGQEALEHLDQGHAGKGPAIDLVLLDVVMPGMDGFEVARRATSNRDPWDLPIIMVTEKTASEDLQAGFEAGAVDYIRKPVQKPELLARVGSMLRLKRETDLRRRREQELATAKEALEAANARLQELSITDPLTGLANRRRLNDFLDSHFAGARRTSAPLSFIMADIDQFKAYNDMYGHQAGDQALQAVAAVFTKVIRRTTDLAARYGGEEMAAVLTVTDMAGALEVAEALRAGVADLGLKHEGSDIADHVTASLGVACANDTRETSPAELIAWADEAMYRAKNQGRNRVFAYDPETGTIHAAA